MHPAPSIIVFTTLSGLGYGLAAVLGLGLLDPAALATKLAYLLALALISGGLLSSTLHLGNPQRAWRALSQWRSSWLSREGVMAIADLRAAALLGHRRAGRAAAISCSPGLLGTALAIVTVYCTAMIYASLKSVQAWHTPLTPLCYLLFAAVGRLPRGAVFAAAGGGDGLGFMLLSWRCSSSWPPGSPNCSGGDRLAAAEAAVDAGERHRASASSAASACSSGRMSTRTI